MHDSVFGAYGRHSALSYCIGPLCLHIDSAFKKLLLETLRPHSERVYEWALRVELQARGTLHIHLAMWVIHKGDCEIAGRTGEQSSPLAPRLESLFSVVGLMYNSAMGI